MRYRSLLVLAAFLAVNLSAVPAYSSRFSGRIVSLAPSVTECLFAMGAGSLVAGVTDPDVFPERVKGLPSVGGFYDPSLEKIMGLSPDLVIGVETFHARLFERLGSLGIETLPLTIHRGLDGVREGLVGLGERMGREEEARKVWKKVESELDMVAAETLKAFPGGAPSVMVVVWHDPLTVAGGVNFINDILSWIGIPNAAGDIEYTFPQIDPEGIISRDPDIILVPQTERGMSLSPETLEKALRGLPVRAVQQGSVIPFSADLLFHPGPRVGQAAASLLRSLLTTAEEVK